MKDYYRILQVSPEADPEVIQVAYDTLVGRYSAATDSSSERRLGEVHQAYQVLSDPVRRKEYRERRYLGVIVGVVIGVVLVTLLLFRVFPRTVPPRSLEPTPATASGTASPDGVTRPAYAAGEAFYLEDFSSVERGHLPDNWTGGEKLLVDEAAGQKFVRGFEEVREGHSVVVSPVPFPQDYELEWVVTLGWPVTFCEVGSLRAGLDKGVARLNDAQLRVPVRQGETVRLSLRKRGSVVELFVDGGEVLVGRYPEDSRTPDSFALELGDGCTLHRVRGTALSTGEE